MSNNKQVFDRANSSLSSERAEFVSNNAKMNKIFGMQKSHFIFYLSIVAFPILQFLVFFVYMNINSFILAFQRYDIDVGGYVFYGFKNFAKIFADFTADEALSASVKNSLILFLWLLIFSNLGTLFFSYYIYKNHFSSKIFKVILYSPHIISVIIMVIMYTYFVESTIPQIWKDLFGKEIYGLKTNHDTRYVTVLFFCIWMSFGTQVLVYSGAMSGISESIIESAKLDGVTPLKELFLIILPMVWPTTITFILSAVAGIFVNQMNLYSFFGNNAPPSMQTFGYLLYSRVQQGDMMDYPYLAALGLLMTFVAAPVTLFIRHVMEKFGPSVN